MLCIDSLTHKLGNKTVLKDVSLTVHDSGIMGIVGINGAGKTTLLRLLAGVYIPDSGSITYDGQHPTDPKVRQGIFFLPDEPYYTAHSTPDSIFEFYKTFYPNADKEQYHKILKIYGIEGNEAMRNFSKGMRRQTFVALALALKPRYLLLDEAFDGLDPLARKVFKEHIAALVDQSGTGVLISSHSLRELEDFCDSFVLIDDHTVKSYGDISEHVERLCKFELAFTHTVTNEFFADIPACSVNVRGKFATVVMEGEPEKCMELLRSLSPVIMDQVAVDFEEAFIHDVNKDRGVL